MEYKTPQLKAVGPASKLIQLKLGKGFDPSGQQTKLIMNSRLERQGA